MQAYGYLAIAIECGDRVRIWSFVSNLEMRVLLWKLRFHLEFTFLHWRSRSNLEIEADF